MVEAKEDVKVDTGLGCKLVDVLEEVGVGSATWSVSTPAPTEEVSALSIDHEAEVSSVNDTEVDIGEDDGDGSFATTVCTPLAVMLRVTIITLVPEIGLLFGL